MPTLTPERANEIVEECPDAAALFKRDGSGHRKYGYRHRLLKPTRREINIAAQGTKDGTTVYINKKSCSGEDFPSSFPERHFPGVTVTRMYPRGTTGVTGDKGLSSAAASCPTLDPRDHDVLRLSCTDPDGFRRLVEWYVGDLGQEASDGRETPPRLPAVGPEAPLADAEPQAEAKPGGRSGLLPDAGGSSTHNASSMSEDEELRLMSDPLRRRAVERRAVDLAVSAYQEKGFLVQELGMPFDLLCTPTERCPSGTPVVHVEVKGSIGPACTVHLTRNEVSDARIEGKTWRTDLFIVSHIRLDEAEGTIAAGGGTPRCIEGWIPHDCDLTPTDFVYRVPRHATEPDYG